MSPAASLRPRAMKQCEATTRASTYADTHRCLKKHGIERVGGRYLCAHHKNARNHAAVESFSKSADND